MRKLGWSAPWRFWRKHEVEVTENAAEPEQPAEPADALPRGTESIILVDDDPGLRDASAEILTHLGYTVTLCKSGGDVLARIGEAPDGFDLLITDYDMPDMDGQALAKKIHALNPKLPIILCTGYAREINPLLGRAAGITDFYVKPLAPESLSRLIRRVLDGERLALPDESV